MPVASRRRTLSPRVTAVLLALAVVGVVPVPAAAGDTRGSAWNSVAHLDPGLATVGDALQEVIVSAEGGVRAAADAVRRVGGEVGEALDIVNGVEASVPGARLVELARTPGVVSISANRHGQFEELSYDSDTGIASGFVKSTQATSLWSAGYRGEGIGVAVLDTGISQMKDFEGRVVYGPDLSGEGRIVDTFGHGTVMAGAIAGSGADSAGTSQGAYTGVAPKAHLVAVKVAGRSGAVDVSTVLQGMHWISAYAQQYNIRVLNLSFGVASTQDPAVDPLNYAVERLWKQGIVVVVSAGNSGPGPRTITKPADDPMVLTVGAYDDNGSANLSDDKALAWSSQGPTAKGLAKPDLVAPGKSLVLARSFGSRVEAENPKATVWPSYIRGSGTSEAAAVTSGAAAVLLSARPSLTPDQVKGLLTGSAVPLPKEVPVTQQGAGRLQLAAALTAPAPTAVQTSVATGLGSLEASRGGRNVVTSCPGSSTSTVIIGEIDVRCEPWDPAAWTGSTWQGDAWTGSTWQGSTWQGSTWQNAAWTGSTWQGSTWQGGTWAGSTWQGSTWQGSTWQGSTWQGSTWQGSTWQGSTWQGSTWQTGTWTSGEYDVDEPVFMTGWYGRSPKAWQHFPGERSEPLPSGLPVKACQRDDAGC